MTEVGISMGPDALRAPAGPLPADPADDADLPAELAGLKRRGRAPGHRVGDHRARAWCRRRCTTPAPGSRPASATSTPTTRRSGSSSAAYNADLWRDCCASIRRRTSPTPIAFGPDAENIIVLANPVQPHSEGEIVLRSADPARGAGHPDELLRRPARPRGHGRRGAPVAGDRAELARDRETRSAAGAAGARREARARRGHGAERRAARGPGPALRVDRLPPDEHLPDRRRRRPGCG